VSIERSDDFSDRPITRRRLVEGGLVVAAGAMVGGSAWARAASAATEQLRVAPVPTAKKLVAFWEKPPSSFTPPGPAFDASKTKGKTVYGILLLAVPFAQINKAGYEAGLNAAGVKLVALDGKAQVQETSRAIEQAIAQNADLILVETLPGKLFAPDFAKAKAKGIPVIMVENQDPGKRLPDEPKSVTTGCDQCHRCVGKIMADFAVADSGDNGKIVIVWSADIPGIGQPQLDGIKSELKRLGSKLQVEIKNVPIARWNSDLPTLTQTIVRDTNVKYLLPLYDGMVLLMLPSIHAANAQNRVKVVTFNATPSVLESMKKGDIIAADFGASPEQFGWAWADQTLRVLSGVPPVSDVKLPIRLFTRNNIDSINLKAQQQTWYGNVDFGTAYKKLWKVA
jgi:ribose transport system substrate-binding protein